MLQQPVKSIPGTQSLHYAVAINTSDLQVRPVSPFSGIPCDAKVVSIVEPSQATALDGDIGHSNEVSPVCIALTPAEDDLVSDDYVVVK
jgi:hypothetical protein